MKKSGNLGSHSMAVQELLTLLQSNLDNNLGPLGISCNYSVSSVMRGVWYTNWLQHHMQIHSEVLSVALDYSN